MREDDLWCESYQRTIPVAIYLLQNRRLRRISMVVSCCFFVDGEDWVDEKDCLRKITGREIWYQN